MKSMLFMINIKFNYQSKMIRRLFRGMISLSKLQKLPINTYQQINTISHIPKSFFSQNKTISVPSVPQEVQEVKSSTAKIGEEEVQFVQTKGSISIMDKVQGVKAANGQLYVLSFTCTKCQTKSIRSFTKHAYHKGVVLVRCGGCDNIHLVADNIGWFQDKPVNVESMHEGKVKRVHDPVAITKFLKTAFQDEQSQKPKQKIDKA